MNGIFRVKEITGFRSFKSKKNKGEDETVNVVGLILCDGMDQIYCEAYREQHDVVKNSNIGKYDLVGARLLSWVEERQHEGTTFYTTKYVVQDIELWLHVEPETF